MKSIFIICLFSFISGYSQTGVINPADPRYYKDSIQPIFQEHCTSCHVQQGNGWWTTGADTNGLDLEYPQSFSLMVGIDSYGDTLSPKRKRVLPGNSDKSSLYNKIISDFDSVWFGIPMPAGYALINIDPEAVERIKLWIDAGAVPTAVVTRNNLLFDFHLEKKRDELKIVSKLKIEKIELFNTNGKKISYAYDSKIKLERFKRGVYFLKINFQNQITEHVKVLID